MEKAFDASEVSETYSQYGTPHMIMSGSLKDGTKEGHHACVPRYCVFKISRIECLDGGIPPSVSNVTIFIRMGRTRKTLKSIPIELNKDDKFYYVDFCFCFHYMHNLKPPFDVLQVALHDTTHKRQQKKLAVASISLNQILQCALEDDILLVTPTLQKRDKDGKKIDKKEEKELRKQEKKEEKEAKKKEKKEREEKKNKDNKRRSIIEDTGKKEMHRKYSTEERDHPAGEMKKDGMSWEKEDKDYGSGSTKPVARMTASIALYPEEVESPQDAQLWDDEIMEAVMDDRYISSEEEEYDSEEEYSEEEGGYFKVPLPPQPQQTPPKHSEVTIAQPLQQSLLLADLMKLRYQPNLKFESKQTRRRKLSLKKYLPKMKSAPPKLSQYADGESGEEYDPWNRHDTISLGTSSSSSEDEGELSPPDLSPRNNVPSITVQYPSMQTSTSGSNPVLIRKQGAEYRPDASLLVLIDAQKSKGRKLEEYLKKGHSYLKNNVVATKTATEVTNALNHLISKGQERNAPEMKESPESPNKDFLTYKVVIAGGDGHVSLVVKSFLELMSKKPRGSWQPFCFFVIPVGKKNEIAMHLASLDINYRNLFISPEWKEFFEKAEEPHEKVEEEIQKRILKYVEEAHATYSFPIGEALLNYPSTEVSTPFVQKNVPFIKGLQIGLRDPDADAGEKLQLDYWYAKKKGEGHKEVKSFQFVAVTRLPAVAAALHVDQEHKPTASTFSLAVQVRDKSKKEKMKEALSRFSKKDERKEDSSHVTARINRMTCQSSDPSITFRVLIDGSEWNGVKFVSISPEWHSQVKTFPVQIFSKSPLVNGLTWVATYDSDGPIDEGVDENAVNEQHANN